jgi:hypothetical protein
MATVIPARCDTHTGEWRNGKRVGWGRHTWANGDYWEGEYLGDKQTENGKLVRADDSGVKGSANISERIDSAAEGMAQHK